MKVRKAFMSELRFLIVGLVRESIRVRKGSVSDMAWHGMAKESRVRHWKDKGGSGYRCWMKASSLCS